MDQIHYWGKPINKDFPEVSEGLFKRRRTLQALSRIGIHPQDHPMYEVQRENLKELFDDYYENGVNLDDLAKTMFGVFVGIEYIRIIAESSGVSNHPYLLLNYPGEVELLDYIGYLENPPALVVPKQFIYKYSRPRNEEQTLYNYNPKIGVQGPTTEILAFITVDAMSQLYVRKNPELIFPPRNVVMNGFSDYINAPSAFPDFGEN